jgi:hypothetical protein
MSSPNFNTDDFDFSLKFNYEKGMATIDHFYVNRSIRENGYGSIAIETLKRVALQRDEINKILVRIGGGEKTELFLQNNGFKIVNQRPYSTDYMEGDYGVTAVYKEEWISNDYNRRDNKN